MNSSTLLLGFFVLCSQAASSRASIQMEEGDVSTLLAVKTNVRKASAGSTHDVNAFTAANVVVERRDEDTSDSSIEEDLKRLDEETSDFASNEAVDTDIKGLDKLEEDWSDLDNSLEQKDVAEENFIQAVQVRAEAYLDSARSKIGEGPVAMIGIGVTLLLIAFTVICLCGNMPKRQQGQYEDLQDGAECEVWEKRIVVCPHKARELRLGKLFQEIREKNADETITASELVDLLKHPEVAAEFADGGIHNFHEAMPAYKMLAHKSYDGVSVNLMEFVRFSTSPEGQLMQLFTELDEATQSEDSPAGYVNEDDLHYAMEDPRVEIKFASLGLSPEEAFTVFRVIEAQTGNGLVSLVEFIPGCAKMKSRGRGHRAKSTSAHSGSSNGGRAPLGGVV
jgi:hypothetical protein